MSDKKQLISIIIPVFNESESIGFLLDEVINVMSLHKFNFELIVVNDGSKDNTQQVLKQLTLKIKELSVKPKGILSLQKHHHRAEHWLVTKGNPRITLNKNIINKKPNEHIFIPLGAIHRIQNPGKKPVKIMEAQVGSILKETDIVRYQDIYGRVK